MFYFRKTDSGTATRGPRHKSRAMGPTHAETHFIR